jgi:hypothetical protein
MNKTAEKRQREQKEREWEVKMADHNARVSAQRHAFSRVRCDAARQSLMLAMLRRAWWILDAGDAEAADTLLEFVPEQHANALLYEFFETCNEFDETLYLTPEAPAGKGCDVQGERCPQAQAEGRTDGPRLCEASEGQ